MYIETIWVNSTQNELPQLKLFAVRYHGRIASGPTLADAIKALAQDGGAPRPSRHWRSTAAATPAPRRLIKSSGGMRSLGKGRRQKAQGRSQEHPFAGQRSFF